MEELFGAIKLNITLPSNASKVGYRFYVDVEIITSLSPLTYVNKTFYSEDIIRDETYTDSYKFILPTTPFYTDEIENSPASYSYTINSTVYTSSDIFTAMSDFISEMNYVSCSKINTIKTQIAYYNVNDQRVSSWSNQFDITNYIKICIFAKNITYSDDMGIMADAEGIHPANVSSLSYSSDWDAPDEVVDESINVPGGLNNRINCFFIRLEKRSNSIENLSIELFYRNITDPYEFDSDNYVTIPGQSDPDIGNPNPSTIWASDVTIVNYDSHPVFGEDVLALTLPIGVDGERYFFNENDKLEFVVTCYGKNIVNPSFIVIKA